MRRADLEHIIRAAGKIARDKEIVVVGSQAVLAQFPDAPSELLQSLEADVYPRHHPERADDIEGAMGELSPFHGTHTYYAQGVGPETVTAPEGWEARLVAVRNRNTNGVTGLCLEVHDLFWAKLVAGRPKDLAYCRALLRHRMVDVGTLHRLLPAIPLGEDRIGELSKLLDGLQKQIEARSDPGPLLA